MSQPYCGKCHRWLDDGIPGRKESAVCVCRSPDLTKDPNCHNSGHDHYDPESPIVKMDARVADLEDAIPARTPLPPFTGCTGYPDCPADGTDCHFEREYGVTCDEAAMGVRMPVQPSSPKPTAWPPPAEPDYWRGGPRKVPLTSLDEGYDARRINWSRLIERLLASTYNAIFYGSLLILAKALGIL